MEIGKLRLIQNRIYLLSAVFVEKNNYLKKIKQNQTGLVSGQALFLRDNINISILSCKTYLNFTYKIRCVI